MIRITNRDPLPGRATLPGIDHQDHHFPQLKTVDLEGEPPRPQNPPPAWHSPPPPPVSPFRKAGSKLLNATTHRAGGISSLPRSVLLFSGTNSAVLPVKGLWDSGSSNCIASPATARRFGYYVPDKPVGHGTMAVADGSETAIYGWTGNLRVRPPTHLTPSDGSDRVTALPPMICLVADISEDLIVGFDYIKPMRGGFDRDQR